LEKECPDSDEDSKNIDYILRVGESSKHMHRIVTMIIKAKEERLNALIDPGSNLALENRSYGKNPLLETLLPLTR
jgi:hypothetical protein